MAKEQSIRILVDDFEEIKVKGALPGVAKAAYKAVDISAESLNTRVKKMLEQVFSLLSNMSLQTEDFEVDKIRFVLHIDASGEVSLVSLAKGSLGVKSGLEFTILRRRCESSTN